MNKINSVGSIEYTPTKSNKFNKMMYAVALALSLGYSSPANTQNIIKNNPTTNQTETTITKSDNAEMSGKYNMPSMYKNKLTKFIQEEKDLFFVRIGDTPASMFTVDFVLKEMESDRGISKDNQLLFIWHCVYGVISGKDLYSREDADPKRLEEFRKVLGNIKACKNRYREGIMPFAEKKFAEYDKRSDEADKRSAEARQQSAEYDKRSAEAIRQTMKADSLGIKEMVKYYNLCTKNPETNDENEMKSVISAAKDIIQNCKKYGIDYKAIILKEVGDEKKVNEILRFYGMDTYDIMSQYFGIKHEHDITDILLATLNSNRNLRIAA